MRYFLYVSPTKVEMLHSQIGASYFSKIKAGLKIKLGFAEASVEGETNVRAIYNKAEDVRNYLLSKSLAGTIAQPKFYIDDVAELSFGRIEEYRSSIAFFGGIIAGKKFALIGAASSLVGAVASVGSNHAPYYYTMKFINEALEREDKLETSLPGRYTLEQAVDIALQAAINAPQRLVFTASVLYDSPDILVATPIFVARAD
jgi:hypothetical protein